MRYFGIGFLATVLLVFATSADAIGFGNKTEAEADAHARSSSHLYSKVGNQAATYNDVDVRVAAATAELGRGVCAHKGVSVQTQSAGASVGGDTEACLAQQVQELWARVFIQRSIETQAFLHADGDPEAFEFSYELTQMVLAANLATENYVQRLEPLPSQVNDNVPVIGPLFNALVSVPKRIIDLF